MQIVAVLRMWSNQTVWEAFSAWRACMEIRCDQRSAAEAALARLMHGLEAAASAAWHEHACHQVVLRARMEHALHAMQNQVMPPAS